MLTSFFLVSEPFYIHWQEKFLSVHAKIEKNSQCWQENYLSGNEIWNFFRKIFIFRYHWQVKYLSAIQSVNHFLPVFFDVDKCFSCQCMNFLYFLISLTRIFLVSKPFYIHWQEKFLSVHAKFTVDKSFTCQAMKFETFSGKSLFFNITYLYIYIYGWTLGTVRWTALKMTFYLMLPRLLASIHRPAGLNLELWISAIGGRSFH